MSFNKNWAAYRDGFGSATDNDNYWLGLDKVYRLIQLGSVRLRIEAKLQLIPDLLFLPISTIESGELTCCNSLSHSRLACSRLILFRL